MNILKRGDIVFVDFNNAEGHEQKGYRPAVVLSHESHNQKTGIIIICAITEHPKGYLSEVEIDTRKVKGVALVNQIRTIDVISRNFKVADHVSGEVLSEIIRKLKLIVE